MEGTEPTATTGPNATQLKRALAVVLLSAVGFDSALLSAAKGSSPRKGGRSLLLAALSSLCLSAQPASSVAPAAGSKVTRSCLEGMRLIADAFCIDPYESGVVEVAADGRETPHSPFLPVAGLKVKAASQKGVIPQAYISRNEAQAACALAGKRLCSEREWVTACKGAGRTKYPYGNEYQAGYCVDAGRADPLRKLFGSLGLGRYQFAVMNDARLNQVPDTLAPTGSFPRCTNGYQVFDMVGNLHEWTSDPSGTFRGGFYLDSRLNGAGCDYRTVVHPATYHDYSIGFRCCADAREEAS